MKNIIETLTKKGFWISFAMMLVCSLAGKYLAALPLLNIIGHLVIALILGMLIQLAEPAKALAKAGTGFISGKFIRLGIILLGFRLNLEIMMRNGVKTVVIAVIVVAFTILVVSTIARAFKVDKKLALLASCGCGICGAAAVIGISPSLKASEDEEVISIACVCILGTLFTLILVFIRQFLPLTDVQYGALCGSSLHEIAHAVAAGSAGGLVSEEMSTIVKLSRVLMLAPVSLIFSMIYTNSDKTEGAGSKGKIAIPWFMAGFILTSVIGTYISMPPALLKELVSVAYIVLGMAMAALGVNVDFNVVVKRGGRIFAASTIGSVLLLGLSFFLSTAFF